MREEVQCGQWLSVEIEQAPFSVLLYGLLQTSKHFFLTIEFYILKDLIVCADFVGDFFVIELSKLEYLRNIILQPLELGYPPLLCPHILPNFLA